jgi:hypothetical protein
VKASELVQKLQVLIDAGDDLEVMTLHEDSEDGLLSTDVDDPKIEYMIFETWRNRQERHINI